MCYNTEKRGYQLNVSWASSWDFEEVNSTITDSIANFDSDIEKLYFISEDNKHIFLKRFQSYRWDDITQL